MPECILLVLLVLAEEEGAGWSFPPMDGGAGVDRTMMRWAGCMVPGLKGYVMGSRGREDGSQVWLVLVP